MSKYGIDAEEELRNRLRDSVVKNETQKVRQFPSGAIRDSLEGKEDYIETIPWIAMRRYAQYMTSKKSKYGAGNFKKGITIDSYEEALLRHVQKYLANKYEGQNIEPDEDHLSAMLFNVFGIIFEEERAKQQASKAK